MVSRFDAEAVPRDSVRGSDASAREAAERIIRPVERAIDGEVLLYSGAIDYGGVRQVYEQLHDVPESNMLLVLTTLGGSGDAAFKIARAIRRKCGNSKKFTLLVPAYCKSAGTLVAIGADEIVIGDAGELGPLDVQLQKPDEVGESLSGLTSQEALDTLRNDVFECWEDFFVELRRRSGLQISTRTSAEIAAQMAVQLLEPVVGQIDPMRLGESARAVRVAEEYGRRLGRGLKKDALERLVSGYPSHSFVIDREEASDLFEHVRAPTADEGILARFCEQIAHALRGKRASPKAVVVRLTEGRSTSGSTSSEGHDGVSPQRKNRGRRQPSSGGGRQDAPGAEAS